MQEHITIKLDKKLAQNLNRGTIQNHTYNEEHV